MTALAIIMTGLAALFAGFICGNMYAATTRRTRCQTVKKGNHSAVDYLSNDYKNFLNYDGSEQA